MDSTIIGNNINTGNSNDDNLSTPENDAIKEKGDDATSSLTDSECSSCASCPSFVNQDTSLGPYRLLKTLGIGEFGKIKLGLHTDTKQKVAVKVIRKSRIGPEIGRAESEIQILKSLVHPHILNLIEVIETDTRSGIIMEYCSGGELFEYILEHRSLDEDVARNLFGQLISGVNYMHEKGIVHRDLKLENILFLDSEQTHVIIADFGFATNEHNNGRLSKNCGSPTYAAPELVYPSKGYRGDLVDVWSCGVILYCMVLGFLPFDDDPNNNDLNLHTTYRIIRSTSIMTFPGFVSDEAQDLIRNMLQSDPAKRYSMKDVMNHPWFVDNRRPPLFDMSIEQLEHEALLSRRTKEQNQPLTNHAAVADENRNNEITNDLAPPSLVNQHHPVTDQDASSSKLSEQHASLQEKHESPAMAAQPEQCIDLLETQSPSPPLSSKKNPPPSSIFYTLKSRLKQFICIPVRK
ncbi:kinase-like domain-containing protein [Absidia repens]|uniref:Kinase-like domain-containing protein n=1 Tax=Absidia repens TaxID=90262 RepID=A0A1X2HZW8_9FUNG|nr:kinase-like domain-containing protein [Absidia repens]